MIKLLDLEIRDLIKTGIMTKCGSFIQERSKLIEL